MALVRLTWNAARRAWRWSLEVHRHHSGGLRLYKRHLRWASTAAIQPNRALHWFDFFEATAMRGFVASNPRLIFRALTRYMSVRWGLERRVAVIHDTYTFIAERGGFLAEAMRRPEGGELARLDLGRGQQGRLWLGHHSQFRKEGEITLSLELEGLDGPVMALAFSLERHPGWCLRVGGLQGRKGGDETTIKLVTKAMYGLRPKNLLVLVAQDIARGLGMDALWGVGNGIHIYRARANSALLPARDIRFDFDDLWKEAGGRLAQDGWFQLPLETPRRTPDAVPPNKRSLYAKRYALLDLVGQQVRARLGA